MFSPEQETALTIDLSRFTLPGAALALALSAGEGLATDPFFPGFGNDGINVLNTGLDNMGAIFHPALTLLNAGWIEHTHGDYQFYIDGVTPSVARVLEVLDRERDCGGLVRPGQGSDVGVHVLGGRLDLDVDERRGPAVNLDQRRLASVDMREAEVVDVVDGAGVDRARARDLERRVDALERGEVVGVRRTAVPAERPHDEARIGGHAVEDARLAAVLSRAIRARGRRRRGQNTPVKGVFCP